MSYQLNLLSNNSDLPLEAQKEHNARSKSKFAKVCTTKQAAILLDVSTSTLYRARQAGQLYKKKSESARSIGPNRWQVMLEFVALR